MTSSLTDLAIAADQEFWKIKVAHHSKSSCYPYHSDRWFIDRARHTLFAFYIEMIGAE
jgi:hypothetical protein